MIDLGSLRALLDGDAELSALVADGLDAAVADALNAVTPEVNVPVPQRITAEEFLANVDPGEMPAPGTPGRSYLDLVIAQRAITLTPQMLVNLAVVFGGDSNTMAALERVATRPGSRAEDAFGQQVTQDDVSACYAEDRDTAYRADQAPLDALKLELDVKIGEYLKASDQAHIDAVTAAEAAIKAEHEKRGAVFADNEAPSVLVLGAGR